jgi:hypothetical protein
MRIWCLEWPSKEDVSYRSLLTLWLEGEDCDANDLQCIACWGDAGDHIRQRFTLSPLICLIGFMLVYYKRVRPDSCPMSYGVPCGLACHIQLHMHL